MAKYNLKNLFQGGNLKKRFFLIIVILLLAGLVLPRLMGKIQRGVFKKKSAEETTGLELGEEVIPVKVYKVKKMAFKDTLPAMGSIKGFKEVDLKFETSGILESFNFEEGEMIQESDIIANLNQRDALLKLKYAELELEKARKLFEIGGFDRIKFEQTKLEYESAKSDFDKTNIYAISDGILGSRDVDIGAYVTPNDKIGTFVDTYNVYAEFNIIEKDAPKLKLGQKSEIYVDAFPNATFKGTVDSIAPVIEGRTRTQRIKIELRNKDLKLKPGMFARSMISTYENESALIIPTSSFKKKDADYFIYVVHKDEKPETTEDQKEAVLEIGTIEVRKVEIGYLTQDAAEIAKGLEESELVVVEAYQEFKDKDRVEILEEQETIL